MMRVVTATKKLIMDEENAIIRFVADLSYNW